MIKQKNAEIAAEKEKVQNKTDTTKNRCGVIRGGVLALIVATV